jgi:hypothetical protein
VLARIEQAPAPPSAEEQGAGPVAHDAGVADDPAGCATGEIRVSTVVVPEPCLHGDAVSRHRWS